MISIILKIIFIKKFYIYIFCINCIFFNINIKYNQYKLWIITKSLWNFIRSQKIQRKLIVESCIYLFITEFFKFSLFWHENFHLIKHVVL